MKKILITGGAGFVGSSLARFLRKDYPGSKIVVFDNLRRRGSEINIELLKKINIDFFHGDIRSLSDLNDLSENFDLFIEASAEPSVLAGLKGDPNYLLGTNLIGTLNCLEYARKHAKKFIFLSSSRVYSIAPLRELNLIETDSRYELDGTQNSQGVSSYGVAETFPTHLPRSLYGATKFASEHIIQEYVFSYGMDAVINRCGVIAGSGQFGKTDQGVFTLWVANHYFRKNLIYTGFGGKGKQVRDLLHPKDLYAVIKKQIATKDLSGNIFNIGGGPSNSVSLLELTRLCEAVVGNKVKITSRPETSHVDIPLFISDCRLAKDFFDWTPQRDVEGIIHEIFNWIHDNESQLKRVFE